jgi:hypothetical protein
MPEKCREPLLHHSVVCAHGELELHAWQEQRHFTAPQCRLCTGSCIVTFLTGTETLYCNTVSSVLKKVYNYIPEKNRETSMRHSVVCKHGEVELHAWQEQRHFTAPECRLCTGRCIITFLTGTETFYCTTVSSVHRELYSYIPDRNRDTLLHNSVVCAEEGL